ncbi:hypothetical protein D3C85_1517710 [compost metagenome]
MPGDVLLHSLTQQQLTIAPWLVALDERQPEPGEYSADVLVLQLHGCLTASIQLLTERVVVFGFLVGQAIRFQSQHFEVVRNRRQDFVFRPVLSDPNHFETQ